MFDTIRRARDGLRIFSFLSRAFLKNTPTTRVSTPPFATRATGAFASHIVSHGVHIHTVRAIALG